MQGMKHSAQRYEIHYERYKAKELTYKSDANRSLLEGLLRPVQARTGLLMAFSIKITPLNIKIIPYNI